MLAIERLLFWGGNHILFMNCINITCWKCVFISSWYHAAASRPALNEILMFPVVHLYPTESKKIRNSLKNGEMFTTEQLHDNEAVAPLRCVWDIFLDYPEIETAEINSELYTRKVKKQSCVLVVSDLRPTLVRLIVRWEPPEPQQTSLTHFHAKSLSEGSPAALTLRCVFLPFTFLLWGKKNL